MSRINTNVQSLIAQRVLKTNNQGLNTSLERLSTGLRINRGKDDPAGLIASENLKAEITSTNSAIKNAERADQVVNIAEGGLQEISGLLNELQGLLTTTSNTAGLSTSEREANQQEVDSILQTIDRLAGSTSFQGIKLLNGNLDYNVTNVSGNLTDFRINSAKFETSELTVDVVVTQSAQQAGLFVDFGGTAVSITPAASGATAAPLSLEITGSLGSRELSFSDGVSLDRVASSINTFSSLTGVVASVSGNGIRLETEDYGSGEFVSVRQTGGDVAAGNGVFQLNAANFAEAQSSAAAAWNSTTLDNPIRDAGQDIGGTINGNAATGRGRTLAVNTDFLDVSLTFNDTVAQAVGVASGLSITGGGAGFQLGGNVDIFTRVSLGISDVATRNLGSSTLGFLDDLGAGRSLDLTSATPDKLSDAQKIVTEAIDQVSSLRGRLGSFQKNIVGATIRNLGVALENTSAANSVIRDADFASETANLTRSQILQQAATNTLALANSSPQSVLGLLG